MVQRYKGACLGTGWSQAVFQAAIPHKGPSFAYRNTASTEALMVTQLKNLCVQWIKLIYQPLTSHLTADSLSNKAANFASLNIVGNTISTANTEVIWLQILI